MKVVILYNEISDNPTEDELDVLKQLSLVEKTLQQLNHQTSRLAFNLELDKIANSLTLLKPDRVFNLVESVNNKAELIHLAPSLMDSLKIRYTGCRTEEMFITSNKRIAKDFLRMKGVSTPDWFSTVKAGNTNPDETYIVKPLWEDASVGIKEEWIFKGQDKELLKLAGTLNPMHYFIEEYIDGREFNISLLANDNGCEVLPPAEILFSDFPEDKARIVGYKAKWDESSFEYQHTLRSFQFPPEDNLLLQTLENLCRDCWDALTLHGYARVDIRVKDHVPYVLEINANPCISDDAGFYAACIQKGKTFPEVINSILADS